MGLINVSLGLGLPLDIGHRDIVDVAFKMESRQDTLYFEPISTFCQYPPNPIQYVNFPAPPIVDVYLVFLYLGQTSPSLSQDSCSVLFQLFFCMYLVSPCIKH